MRYLFTFSQAQGTATQVIVENPEVKEGAVFGTQVGVFYGWNEKRQNVYRACKPIKFIAGGGPWSLTEYKGELLEE